MLIRTTRFGSLEMDADETIQFPKGLLGLEDCHTWVLLGDAHNAALGWLQSTTRPDVALAVVSPRRFVPDYQFRVVRSDLKVVALADARDAQILVIVGKNHRGATLNLKAPIVVNVAARTACQVIAQGELPLQYELAGAVTPLRKSA
ncbi:MAG TPA: flagellar assembly protein FliW [Pirellulales bacterium]|nr:flagellar assembly protein FliW [Pirellulales bacterium]